MKSNEKQREKHVPPGEGGKSLRVLGELVTYKVTSDQTGGAYSLFEVTSRPGGGPPPHVQHREDECFYVLEGEFEFLNNDGDVTNVSAGSLIYVPKGNLHAHKNVGSKPARMLVSQTPGGLHERFFEEIGAADKPRPPVPEDPLDVERLAEIAANYGIEILPPPGRDFSKNKHVHGHADEVVHPSARSVESGED